MLYIVKTLYCVVCAVLISYVQVVNSGMCPNTLQQPFQHIKEIRLNRPEGTVIPVGIGYFFTGDTTDDTGTDCGHQFIHRKDHMHIRRIAGKEFL